MNQLKALLSQLSLRQKVSIIVAVVIAGVLLTALLRYRKENDFKPLYTGISQEDASAVVQKLKEGGIEYRLAEDTGTIMVPSARVAETRLTMAGAGLPKTGRIGFELFDKTNFGATDFTEQVNYRRALEGELERSVMGIAAVQQARIHITFPKDSVFLESRQPAKASVMLHLHSGAQLSKANVSAVNYMVSSAVEGLSPDAVTIVDERGTLLSRPKREGLDGGLPSDATLEYQQQLERDLFSKVNHTLEPLLGAEKYRVGVSVDCDFSSGEQSEELMDPKGSVPLSTQRTEESTPGAAGTQGGIPGTASSLPRPPLPAGARTTGNGILRTSENVSYQNSRVVKRTKMPQGIVKRISVAVLIDQNVRWEGTGPKAKRILLPPPPERLKSIRDVVAGTIGFSEQRADQIVVESLPFDSTLNSAPPEAPAKPAPSGFNVPVEQVMKNPKLYGMIGGGVLLALILAFAVMNELKKRKAKKGKVSVRVGGPGALPAAAGGAAATGGVPATTSGTRAVVPGSPLDSGEGLEKRMESKIAETQATQKALEAEAMQSLKLPNVTTKKADVLAKHLRDEVKKDPRSSAQLIRSWLNDN